MCQRARLRIAATIQVTPMKIVTTAVSMLRTFQAFARTFDVSATAASVLARLPELPAARLDSTLVRLT